MKKRNNIIMALILVAASISVFTIYSCTKTEQPVIITSPIEPPCEPCLLVSIPETAIDTATSVFCRYDDVIYTDQFENTTQFMIDSCKQIGSRLYFFSQGLLSNLPTDDDSLELVE